MSWPDLRYGIHIMYSMDNTAGKQRYPWHAPGYCLMQKKRLTVLNNGRER